MGITDRKLLFCHGVVEGNVDTKISTLEYNNTTVYDCFNDPFPVEFGSPSMNIPPITIDDRPPLYKRAQYTRYLLPAAISVVSENSVRTLTTPSDSPDLLPTDDLNTLHAMKKYFPLKFRFKIGYCCRKHGRTRCYKKTRFY